jgi:P27 family predicted phage terminase small subunit
MGQRGPTPTPTEISRVRGFPGKRAPSKLEPKPQMGRPEMPAHLDELAKLEWERLCPLLERMRVLTEADGIALANLCIDYSLLQKAQESLAKTGLLTKTERTGMIHLNPLLALVATTTDRVARALREFGMTPSSRTRVNTVGAKAKGDDPWARYG